MKKEKDKSFHFWLTETKHTSLKELSDQLDRIERTLLAICKKLRVGEGESGEEQG